jgi:hypothetical protein
MKKRSQIAPNGDASGGPDRNGTRTEKEASGSGQANAELSKGRPSQRGPRDGGGSAAARSSRGSEAAGTAAAAEAGSSRRRIRPLGFGAADGDEQEVEETAVGCVVCGN